MKFISYFMVILLLEFSSGIKADNELERLNSEECFNHFDKVSYYLKKVLLNDEEMSKGYVEVLIVDLTLKRDIADLLEKFYHEPRIVVNVISKPVDIRMRSLDFVIVVQDFLNSEFNEDLFRFFQNDINNLLSHNYIGRNEKFIFINMLENSNDKSFMSSFNFGLASALIAQKTIFNLLIIDVYDDGTEDLWRPQFISRDFKLIKPSLNVTTFARSKMGEIHDNRINLVQYDAPPFSYVKNKTLIGVEGKLLDLFCERYNLTYSIVNENTEQYVYRDIINNIYALHADLSLTTRVQMESKVWFVDFIDLHITDGLCMLVPRNIRVSSYENFDYPFDYKILICLLISSCLIVITWKTISMAVHSGFSMNFIIFSVFRYLMGNSATGENRMTYKEKFVVYGYVFVAMILLALYESFVISFMMSDPSYKSVQSFQELNESNTKIYQYYDEIHTVIFRDELIMNRVNLTNDKQIVSLPKDFDHNLAYVTTCQYADSFIRSSGNINGDQRLFDIMDEKITFYAQSYPVSNIFPLKKELQFIVSVLRESGLRDYWFRSEVHENNRDMKEDEKSVLSLNDMQLPFIILGTGLALSFLVYLFELLVDNIKERRNNRVIYL